LTLIYLVRHAHAVWSPDEARPLSAAGAAAAVQVADRLANRRISGIYTSPARRAFDTVAPLAARFGVTAEVVADLRERELPPVIDDFEGHVRRTWTSPGIAVIGAESNLHAQARGVAAIERLVAQHAGEEIVVGTHGTLLTLILNAFDRSFGYEFWQRLSFPDVYRVSFTGGHFAAAERFWGEETSWPEP
jgi:2,3-bisphosphoglycerate-dependent phosphoglycerate mutase